MTPREVPIWWLSFVDRIDDVAVNLGVCIVPGETFTAAVRSAWAFGCNPGGEVAGHRVEVPEGCGLMFRLITEPGDIAEAQWLATGPRPS